MNTSMSNFIMKKEKAQNFPQNNISWSRLLKIEIASWRKIKVRVQNDVLQILFVQRLTEKTYEKNHF